MDNYMNFAARVVRATGLEIADIPVGTPTDLLCGHIIAHNEVTGEWVFYSGYPNHEDDDGISHWDVSSARRVTL